MYKHFHKRNGLLAPNAEMWDALGAGALLRSILTDFYTQVYADAKLSPFFTGITIDRIIDKQFSFLRSIFTGEKCYFGYHPKNAHHWMVITDELFNYRKNMMKATLYKFGLPEHLIMHWLDIEEVFRHSIVKTEPHMRTLDGATIPIDGYNPLVLDVSCLCDHCGTELACGTLGYYHRRTGKLHCRDCHNRVDHSGSFDMTHFPE